MKAIFRRVFRFLGEWYTSLFTSKGKPNPVYLYAFIFISITVVSMIMRLMGSERVDNELIFGVLIYVMGWIGIYNWQKKNNGGE